MVVLPDGGTPDLVRVSVQVKLQALVNALNSRSTLALDSKLQCLSKLVAIEFFSFFSPAWTEARPRRRTSSGASYVSVFKGPICISDVQEFVCQQDLLPKAFSLSLFCMAMIVSRYSVGFKISSA